jgi:hypothetical protein
MYFHIIKKTFYFTNTLLLDEYKLLQLNLGKEGRVVVFGEAALFSVQLVKKDNGEKGLMGMNAPDAQPNKQFF